MLYSIPPQFFLSRRGIACASAHVMRSQHERRGSVRLYHGAREKGVAAYRASAQQQRAEYLRRTPASMAAAYFSFRLPSR